MEKIYNKKVSLVLSGGGARGAFHLGVLQALDDANIDIASISGASIGSIVGASYLSGNSPKDILDIFMSKEFKKSIKFRPLSGGVFSIDFNLPIIDKIINNYQNIEDLPKPLHVSITNINQGKVEYINRGKLRENLLASSAILPLFSAVKIGDEYYADGGIMDNFPLTPLKNSPHKIVGVNLHPNATYNKSNLSSNLKRAIFLCWHSSVAKNAKQCDLYIAPKELVNFPILRTNRLKELFQLGLKSTKDILHNI